VFFHLDQQSWTRQKTTLAREEGYDGWFKRWSSDVMTFVAASVFLALVLQLA
jgi:glycosyltransferase Alg8